MVLPKLLLPALICAAAMPTQATSYCCNDESGRKVCGDILPAQCFNRPYQEFGAQGNLKKQYEGLLTPEQRAQRQAEAARKKEQERRLADEDRRDRALLASYTNVRDIEFKRDRMVADLLAGVHLSEERLAEAVARQQKLAGQLQAMGDKPVPESLRFQQRKSDGEVAAQKAAIESKKQDIADVQKRFEEDKQRYLMLTQKRSEEAATHPDAVTRPASSSTSH
jgi:hypothetical protein